MLTEQRSIDGYTKVVKHKTGQNDAYTQCRKGHIYIYISVGACISLI